MIIQKQKDYEDILACLEGETSVFLGGCSDCATACKTGGEEELAAMKEKLEADGKTVTGFCFTPQDGNSLLSSMACALWYLDGEDPEPRLEVLRPWMFAEI